MSTIFLGNRYQEMYSCIFRFDFHFSVSSYFRSIVSDISYFLSSLKDFQFIYPLFTN